MTGSTSRPGTGRSWLAFAIGATFAALALARGHLPNPAAVHWDGSGVPNGADSPWRVAIVTSVISAVISAAVWRVHPRGQRAVNGFLATMLLMLQTVILWANWGRHHWQDAASVQTPLLLVLVLPPVIVSYLAANYGEPKTPGANHRRTGGLAPLLIIVVGAVLLIQLGGAVGGALLAALMPLAILGLFLAAASRKARAEITLDARALTVTLRGMEAMLCVRRVVSVPTSAVRSIEVADRENIPRPGMRMPGTALPGLIIAGSYGFAEARSFWDVRRSKTLLLIECDPAQAEYCRIVLEVDDPAAMAAQLRLHLASGDQRVSST